MTEIVKKFILQLIIFSYIFVVVSEFDAEKLTPTIGLVGSIAGYLLAYLIIKASSLTLTYKKIVKYELT